MSAPPRGYPVEWYPVDPLNFGATITDVGLISREGRLYGWAFEETTGTAVAQFELIDGSSNNGNRIVPITLAANESTRDWLGKPGLRVRGGLWVHIISGSIRGTCYYLGLTEGEIMRQAGYSTES